MAIHELNEFERIISQSVTLYTAKHVSCPVIFVPEHAAYNGIKNIALACDLRTIYSKPVEVLKDLIAAFHSTLHILHVVKPGKDKRFGVMMLTRHHLNELNPIIDFIESDKVEQGLLFFIRDHSIDVLIIMFKSIFKVKKHTLKNLFYTLKCH